MERGPISEIEWQKYSSYNIEHLKKLPMAELVATKQILQEIYAQGIEVKEKGQIPNNQLEGEIKYLDVTAKRINIVGTAIFNKIETLIKNPNFK